MARQHVDLDFPRSRYTGTTCETVAPRTATFVITWCLPGEMRRSAIWIQLRDGGDMSVTSLYEQVGQTPRELQRIINDLLETVDKDPTLAEDIRTRGVDPAGLSADAITIKPASSGLDAATVTLIVTF